MLVQNVSPLADINAPSLQELEFLINPLFKEYFTTGNQSVSKSFPLSDNSKYQGIQPITNIQPTTGSVTLTTNVNAEENNYDQPPYAQIDENEFYNIFSTPDELHQLDRLQVWELVDKPFSKTIVNLKWLWKNKKDEDQTEEVYAAQPDRTVDLDHPKIFYHLTKALYGMKQAPTALYCRGKENGVNILKSIDEGQFQMGTIREPLAEETQGAPHLGPERPRVYSDLSPKEKDQYNVDIRNVKMTMSRMQLNSKFVNNMLPKWGRFVTVVKLNRGLRDSKYDQLYAYLKQHEAHANENKMILDRFTQHTRDPLALMSNANCASFMLGWMMKGRGISGLWWRSSMKRGKWSCG
nr:retrotransposon protein, putative, unclassified [Tanacetum cinerariifolium]